MTPQSTIPSTPPAWLEEIAKAYCDAYETLPFGKFVGREIKPEDLFHLGPAICLKFRGVKNSKQNLKRATDGALTSYVATKENVGDLFDIPEMSFAFSYVASHYGLGLVDEHLATLLLEFLENNLHQLLELINKNSKEDNMNDHYLDLVHFHWDTIYRAYSDFADKKPVILLHLKEAKVYSYPFSDFKATLSSRSQKSLDREYKAALKNDDIVIFVRDDDNRKLVSVSMPAEPAIE
jgi:hypothetical protein